MDSRNSQNKPDSQYSQYKQKPPAGTTRCLVCGGWGVVPRYHRDMADRKECPQCNGDGFVSAVTAVTDTSPPAPVRAIPDPFACLRDGSEAGE